MCALAAVDSVDKVSCRFNWSASLFEAQRLLHSAQNYTFLDSAIENR
jgi:hypothetical protein